MATLEFITTIVETFQDVPLLFEMSEI